MTAPRPRVEIRPPDIGPWREGGGPVEHVVRRASGRPGPHLVLNALMHGNELCGAVALDRLLRLGVEPLRGSLTLVFANVAAYRAFDPARPAASRFLDEDMNRVWGDDALASDRTTRELRRARELLPVFLEADAVLDLHSMTEDAQPLVLCGATPRGRALAREIGYPTWIVADAGHQGGKRLIDHGPFADPDGGKTAILVECGQHWLASSAEVAFETACRFLAHFGLVAPDFAAAHRRPPPLAAPVREVEVTAAVTVGDDRFRFAADFRGLDVVPEAGTLLAWDGDREVRTPYADCVLIMPSRRLKRGQTAVRLGRIVA
jgi:predicted deacylase